jgi:hypothetical protein
MSRIVLHGVFALVVGACTGDHEAGKVDSAQAANSSAGLEIDLAVPRFCTITAYESPTEGTKFAVGDFAVGSAAITTPTAMPLSKVVRTDEAGQLTEARFGIYFRHLNGRPPSLLTPYTPLPLRARDATSMTFETPPDIPGGGSELSTLRITAPDAGTVVLEFTETVHGQHSRSMTIACGVGDAG